MSEPTQPSPRMAERDERTRTVKDLRARIRSAGLAVMLAPSCHEEGDMLELNFTTVWPEREGRASFRVEKFVGGGFAGQVYRGRLESLQLDDAASSGLKVGGVYAVKIMRPPSSFGQFFRDALYRIGFQAPFSAEVNEAACRAGLLWPRLLRLAAARSDGFGDPGAIAEVHASFFDAAQGAYGEIREWVEGRAWRLESDLRPWLRRRWREIEPRETDSPEYVAKRRFMDRLVRLMHEMGAPELARQYEWWTLKSQPNVLKRDGLDADPAAGLCAVDFRAGLVLLPFLPMSPRDLGLIGEGLKRGSLVQFDRCQFDRLRTYLAARPELEAAAPGLAAALEAYDRAYRRGMPDVFHQGVRLLLDPGLRRDVCAGLVHTHLCRGAVDADGAARLRASGWKFLLFACAGFVPLLGRRLRRAWGHAEYRRHLRWWWTVAPYRRAAVRAGVWGRLIEWVRAGRCGTRRAAFLADHPCLFWAQRLTLGWLPRGVHRAFAEPSWVWASCRQGWRFIRDFFTDEAFRRDWLRGVVEDGYADGMLDDASRRAILDRIEDPFIGRYLKCLAVHFATLPITQLVSGTLATIVAAWALVTGRSWAVAATWFGGVLLTFQVLPVSPGSLVRGCYVVALMIRERRFRDYVVAAPLSFVKYIGYLAFPIQMVARYPHLAQFMAGRWATQAAHVVPVFGEKGALLEHAVFDLFFNRSRLLGAWAGRRIGLLLSLWMLLGAILVSALARFAGMDATGKTGINVLIAVVCLFVLPRVLFYPLLRHSK